MTTARWRRLGVEQEVSSPGTPIPGKMSTDVSYFDHEQRLREEFESIGRGG